MRRLFREWGQTLAFMIHLHKLRSLYRHHLNLGLLNSALMAERDIDELAHKYVAEI